MIEDLQDWTDDIATIEHTLKEGGKKSTKTLYPAVRQCTEMAEVKNKENNVETRIKSYDYAQWDKYDAESECLKLDVEEEKKREQKEKEDREEIRKKAQELAMQKEERITEQLKDSIRTLTEGEKKVMALKEKELGNEYYKVNDLDKAIIHYTRSIIIHPTAVAYNNRAATYLKQCKYSKALEDTNIVLQMDPNNVKAYYRRALSLQHKNEFHKALDDIREVLKREPNHVIARHVADQLRDHCRDLPRKCKLLMKDDQPNNNPNNMKVVEVTEDEMLRDYKDKNFIEVNDWGLPKIMCNCNGKYTNDPGIRHDHRLRFQHLNKRNQKNETVPNKSSNKDTSSITISKIEDISEKKIAKRPLQFSVGDKHSGQSKRLEILETERIVESKMDTEISEQEKMPEGIKYNNNKHVITPEVSAKHYMTDVEMLEDNLNKLEQDLLEYEKSSDSEEFDNMKTKDSTCSDLGSSNESVDKIGVDGKEKKNVCSVKKGSCRIEEDVGCKKIIIERKDTTKGSKKKEVKIPGPEESTSSSSSSSPDRDDDTSLTNEGASQRNDASAVLMEIMRETSLFEQRLNSFEAGFNEMTPQPPIEVAKKYREKVSQPKRNKQQISTSVKTYPETQNMKEKNVNGEGDGFYQSKFYSPHEFWQKWSILEKTDGTFEEKTRLLRSIRPHLLQAVIGSKLDDIMLGNFLNCLQKHFNMHSEPELIMEYLTAIMQLERFSIIYCFLSEREKMIAHNLLEMLGPYANEQLLRAYKQ